MYGTLYLNCSYNWVFHGTSAAGFEPHPVFWRKLIKLGSADSCLGCHLSDGFNSCLTSRWLSLVDTDTGKDHAYLGIQSRNGSRQHFSTFFGGHGWFLWSHWYPFLDFRWRLLWFWKPEWTALFLLGRGIPVTCSLIFTSGATPANLLAANMVAKPFSSIYLWAGIGGVRSQVLPLTVWDQAYDLPTELCRHANFDEFDKLENWM